jgi:Xaa-Pro aminopeptidase
MSFAARRAAVLKRLTRPLVLFSGAALSRNYPANTFPFRADSNFLYFFDRPEAGSAALFDPAEGTVTLFLPERSLADALWHGEVESFEAAKARHEVDQVLEVEKLEAHLTTLAKGRQLDAVAVADFKATQRARAITGQDLQFDDPARVGRGEVLDVLASLRLKKGPEELAEMRKTAIVTHEAHVSAMRASKPGVPEAFLNGLVEGAFARSGCVPAYGTILSVRGEVLHNHDHGNTLAGGDIVLLDAGAEGRPGYCSDVTRCWPVGGPFSAEGRDVYELVLEAETHAISLVKPGVRYRDLHLSACKVLAQGLVDLGLLSGSVDGLVEAGAHAMFFPHGLGHQIGLDVHDLESFGDRVHYPGRQRSAQFGLAYLRMDMDLAEGMVFSIEPGLYFVPAILRSTEFRDRFKGQVMFEKAERFLAMNQGRGFGGIRIEDDVLCTSTGSEVLTAAIPKTRVEIEALAGQG